MTKEQKKIKKYKKLKNNRNKIKQKNTTFYTGFADDFIYNDCFQQSATIRPQIKKSYKKYPYIDLADASNGVSFVS